MKVNRLKRKLNKDALYATAIFVLVSIIAGLTWMKAMQDEQEIQRIKGEISNLDADYLRTRDKIDKAKKQLTDFMALPENKIPTANVDTDITSWIREAREPLLKLKNSYKLNSLDLSLTPPTELKDGAFKRDSVMAISSKVTLKFDAASDELIFSFVDDLINHFPGYVRVESIDITRSGEITETMLSQVIAQGTAPSLVNGTLVFEWVKLKHIIKSAPGAMPTTTEGITN